MNPADKKKWNTEQEAFWAGGFGDEYISRNREDVLIEQNRTLFKKVFEEVKTLESAIEFGANVGLNLLALRKIFPQAGFSAVEINAKAVQVLEGHGLSGKIYHTSILDFAPDTSRELAFTKGVLIHIHPDYLPKVYDLLYQASRKYVLIAEYYNPTPVILEYRGHQGKLFKRDFAGEMLARYPDLELLKYGFAYHGDPQLQMDDLTWFLMKKKDA